MKSNVRNKQKSVILPQGETKDFGLIVNANAGKVQSGQFDREYFARCLGEQGIIRETKTLAEVAEVLKEFQQKKIAVLYIYGGDGTQQKVISQILDTQLKTPYVVPLKGGTMNMLVKDLGLGGSSKKVFRAIMDRYLSSNKEMPFIKKPVLRIMVNSDKPYYGFYFANGAIFKLMQQYYKLPSSVYNACRVSLNGLLGSLFSFHPYASLYDSIRCEVDYDGRVLCQNQFLGMMISTLNRVVFGITPFGKKSAGPNEIFFKGYSFNKKWLIPYLPFLATGMKMNHRNIHSLTFEEINLRSDTGFILDGELYDISKPSTIKIDIGGYLNIPIVT